MTLTTRYCGKRIGVVGLRRSGNFAWCITDDSNHIELPHVVKAGIARSVPGALMTAFMYVDTRSSK